METFVTWWCNLIGVTSPGAIDTASGIVAGGLLIGAIWIVIALVITIITSVN